MTLNNIVEETEEKAPEIEIDEVEEIEELTDTVDDEEVAEADNEDEKAPIELEDTPKKTYTEDELEEIAKQRERRAKRKMEREYEKQLAKYKELERVMNAGTGKTTLDDIITSTTSYYKEEGIEIPENKPRLSDEEVEVLAKYKAQKILDLQDIGMVEEELEDLASKGRDNMSAEEKVIFQTLGEYVTKEKDAMELKTLGVDKAVLDSPEFKDLRSKYNGSAKEVYDLYKKIYKVEETPKSPGAMNTKPANDGKEFYSETDVEKLARKYTPEQLAKNPKLFDKIKQSMGSW